MSIKSTRYTASVWSNKVGRLNTKIYDIHFTDVEKKF